jgi:hypothetical protein
VANHEHLLVLPGGGDMGEVSGRGAGRARGAGQGRQALEGFLVEWGGIIHGKIARVHSCSVPHKRQITIVFDIPAQPARVSVFSDHSQLSAGGSHWAPDAMISFTRSTPIVAMMVRLGDEQGIKIQRS